jgi:hypothetical protein
MTPKPHLFGFVSPKTTSSDQFITKKACQLWSSKRKMSAPDANTPSMISGHAQYAKGYVAETSKDTPSTFIKSNPRS